MDQLQKYLKDDKISVDTYLKICIELNKPPDLKKMPVDFESLYDENKIAVAIFSRLPNKLIAEIGYVGKDYSSLEFLCKIYEIKDHMFLLELLSVMDNFHIAKSSTDRQASLKKMKKSGK